MTAIIAPRPWRASARALRRFMSNLGDQRTDACVEWVGGRNRAGYGVFYAAKGDKWLAHRFAMSVHLGINPGSVCVLHRCDNPPCCNPRHLFLGTRGDNVADCWAKGRRVHSMRGRCKNGHLLTPETAHIWKSSRSRTGLQRRCKICIAARRARLAEANNPKVSK